MLKIASFLPNQEQATTTTMLFFKSLDSSQRVVAADNIMKQFNYHRELQFCAHPLSICSFDDSINIDGGMKQEKDNNKKLVKAKTSEREKNANPIDNRFS